MLKRFFARSANFYGLKYSVFLDPRPPHSEFEGTRPSKGTFINPSEQSVALNQLYTPRCIATLRRCIGKENERFSCVTNCMRRPTSCKKDIASVPTAHSVSTAIGKKYV